MKQTQFAVRVVGGSIAVTFPATPTALSETTNAPVTAGAGAATTVLAANANRRFAQIINRSGADLAVRIGGAASAVTTPLPNNSTFDVPVDPLLGIPTGLISVFNPTGGDLDVNVIEWE